jgi:formylglycine-generating enzyme required for sulfatase activity
LVSELADHPNRLLVTATVDTAATPASDAAQENEDVTQATGEMTYAEVAHEAIFRRWDKLREWIAAEREFLAWRSGLEAARQAWAATPDASKRDALLMGVALAQAQSWLARRAEDLPAPEREFIAQSIAREKKAQARARRVRSLVYLLLIGIIAGLVGWINQKYITQQWRWYTFERPFLANNVWPFVLSTEVERALQPDSNQSFRECAPKRENQDYCPDMVAVPGGTFLMGTPATIGVYRPNEEPQHVVTILNPFAVSKFELTFDQWDTCVSYGDCPQGVSSLDWGRGQRPVINVTWADAERYVAWLSKVTAKPYRLLSESEYEYAARAMTTTKYPWGDQIGTNNANCIGCGSRWDQETAPVGSFPANRFGLYDMVGNIWEWVEDCWHAKYLGAPSDGSAWIEGGDCGTRVIRGGGWNASADEVRSAYRSGPYPDNRREWLGFRIARTLQR